MLLKVGPIEVRAEMDGTPSPELLNLTMKYLQEAQEVIATGKVATKQELSQSPTPVYKPPEFTPMRPVDSHALLKTVGFSNHTIVMIARRVLNVHTKGTRLTRNMPEIEREGVNWFNRELSEPMWALFLGPVNIPKLGHRVATLGLNAENNLTILGLFEGTSEQAVEELVKRGLPANKVQFIMPAFNSALPPKVIKQVFPKAKVGADWQEFISNAEDEDAKEELKEAMVNPNRKEAARVIEEHDGPKELLTYYDFDPKLWRVLRSSTALVKTRRELKSRLKDKAVSSPEQVQLVTLWSVLRLQYQWYKVPADIDPAENLKDVRVQLSEL